MQQKLVPDPFFILVKNPKQLLHERIPFKNKIFSKGMIKNLSQSLTLFFLLNPVPFNEQRYRTQRGLGTSDQSLFRLRHKFTKNSLLVMYYQTKFDDVI